MRPETSCSEFDANRQVHIEVRQHFVSPLSTPQRGNGFPRFSPTKSTKFASLRISEPSFESFFDFSWVCRGTGSDIPFASSVEHPRFALLSLGFERADFRQYLFGKSYKNIKITQRQYN